MTLNDQFVLSVIERICGDDFCEDMELQHCTETPPPENDPVPWPHSAEHNLRTAIDKLSSIYRLAHSHVKAHSCYPVHEDWRKEAATHPQTNGTE